MLTPTEQAMIQNIRARIKNNMQLQPHEKQLVIDLHIREHKPVKMAAALIAQAQGFNVAGLRTISR